MSFRLGTGSRRELAGVHPRLVAVVERAIILTNQDFTVHDGLRTEAEQREYVRRGVSKTLASKHIRQGDGFGHAVDLVPYVNGRLRWEWKPIFSIAAAVRDAAEAEGLALIWGGVWDRKLGELGRGSAAMEQAVNAYVARRRGMGKTAFIDGPHFELAP
ncbi:M15 family metallopeptidase [Sphingomonas koreensis]|uniref:M15 family metallopeptidase n=1 Tax=Sphingomonas koreensis TaxID=93064 RepID=UPI000F7E0B89|nr:M15 family metallopeptidase [Sphingomonas koreensis]MDC7808783.1 M15 family metallopeptidase [Sphingomonas koreensis]RSU98924.1 M15 family peptidase [Sphingomonas koreensis]